jgi:hypothetical protein
MTFSFSQHFGRLLLLGSQRDVIVAPGLGVSHSTFINSANLVLRPLRNATNLPRRAGGCMAVPLTNRQILRDFCEVRA